MNNLNRVLFAIVVALPGGISPALAIDGSYRPNQPEVIAPAHDEASETEGAIRAARTRHGLSGQVVALYWNREPPSFDDSVVKQTTIDHWESGNVTPSAPGGLTTDRRGRTVVTEREGPVELEQIVREGPGAGVDAQLRDAFVQTLRAAGVRVVDASRGQSGPELNLVVLLAREPAAEHGWSFRVSLSDVSRTIVMADFSTLAQKDERSRAFVATDRGFARRGLTLHDVGEALALETLSALRRTNG